MKNQGVMAQKRRQAGAAVAILGPEGGFRLEWPPQKCKRRPPGNAPKSPKTQLSPVVNLHVCD